MTIKDCQNTVVVIAGPTASGKSALAIDVAKQYNGVVLNCDSMQIYKDIPIIAATPTKEDKQLIEHRLFELYDCDKRGNVVEWLDLCVAEIESLWAENRLPVVVGGTGMYVDALLNGVTPIPEVSVNIRAKVNDLLEKEGLQYLHNYLKNKDKEIAAKLHENDKTRIVRAVEIIEETGTKVSEWYKIPMIKKLPEAKFLVIKIVPSLDDIEDRCRLRLDKMVYEWGALKEIEMLLAKNIDDNLPAMKALGVPELSLFLKNQCSLDEAVELAKLHTRQYAKRQRTWLKNKLNADIVLEKAYIGQKDYLQRINSALNL
jgi:tRNA dimethylallyltransferase